MSAIPFREAEPLLQPRPRVRHRASDEPAAAPRRRKIVRRKASVVGPAFVVFSMSFLVAYTGSILLGNAVAEQAKFSARRAATRSEFARAEVDRLQAHIDRTTSLRSVENWASARGMTSAFRPALEAGH
ncbi:MAG: hypothetical protein KIT11_11770 [Fimbriimonadaceae bacterium]|nr:hypothetical protein [Fimbriimonadaceae bacterium]QYK55288.1 MAG: hypothetical protein KF733_09765 [Fimbriimonadaceae bacterium]